jgi:hypothetical protein
MGWGLLTQVVLPGGGSLGVYQPRHARPKAMLLAKQTRKNVTPATTMARRKATKKKVRGR